MADGSIIIDTKIDSSGAESGVNSLNSKLSSVANKGFGLATKAAKVMTVGVTATSTAVCVLTKKCT